MSPWPPFLFTQRVFIHPFPAWPHTHSDVVPAMKMLVRPNQEVRFPEDIQSLRSALNKLGYDASDRDIAWAWRNHSDERCAQWLIVDGDEKDAHFLLEILVPA